MNEKRRIAAGLLALFLFLLAFGAAKILNLDDKQPSSRLQYHAMPVAMSVLYFGHPHDYTANFSVAMAFQNARSFDDNVRRVLDPRFSRGTDIYYWNVDDRGSADFAILASWIFGPTLKGMFHFYFVIFGLIIGAFLVGHWRAPVALSFLILAQTAYVVCLSLWTAAPFSGGEPSIHMSESRLFELLSLFTLTHLFFFALQRRRATASEVAALAVQLCFFTFLLHARSSIMWQVVAFLFLFVMCVAVRYRDERAFNGKAAAMFVVLSVAVFAVLPMYKHAVYNPAYFANSGQRTTWHNLVLGFSFSPEISRKYEIYSTDYYAIQAVLRFAHKNEPDFPIAATTQLALNSLGSHDQFDWRTHERHARDFVFRIFQDNPGAFIQTFVYDKPKTVLILSSCLIYPKISDLCNVAKPQKVMPSIVIWLVCGAALIFFASVWRCSPIARISRDRSIWRYTACIALFGLTPSILFYPTLVTMAAFLMFSLILGFLGLDRLALLYNEKKSDRTSGLAEAVRRIADVK